MSYDGSSLLYVGQLPSAVRDLALSTFDLGRRTDGWVNAREFGAVGDGVADDTAALQAAIDAKQNGGVVLIPIGRYKLSAPLVLYSGVTIRGESHADWNWGELIGPARAATHLFISTDGDSVFLIGGSVRDTVIENLTMGAAASPGATTAWTANRCGVRMSGHWPESAYRHRFEHLTFYNLEHGIQVVDDASPVVVPWQADGVMVRQCVFYFNRYGAYFNTGNADYWKFDTCSMLVPTSGFGIYAKRVGFLTIDNTVGGGTGYGPTGGTFLYLDEYWDVTQIRNSQMEGIGNFVHVGPSGGSALDMSDAPIIMLGSISECPNKIERPVRWNSYSSRYSHPIAVTAVQESVQVASHGDVWVRPFDAAEIAASTLTPTGISGDGALVTVALAAHGLTAMDRIDATGSSTSGYNVTDAQVIWVDANSFRYYASGTGTPVTLPSIYRRARYQIEAGGPHVLREFPPRVRRYPGTPNNALDPLYVGEDVLDTVNGIWYRSKSLAGNGWVALNS